MSTCTSTEYQVGEQIIVEVTFRDSGGALADPTAITFKVRDPTGAITLMDETDATHPSLGVFRWQMPPFDRHGTWTYGAYGTAGVITSVEEALRVDKSAFS